MGLAERRRILQIKESHAPRFQKELNEAVGFELPLEIELASFPEDKTVLDCYDYYYESYGPGLLVTVFRHVCQDQLGKDAVKAKIQKIILRNTAASAEQSGEKAARLEGGTLIVEESFYGYSDKLFGEDELRGLIENML